MDIRYFGPVDGTMSATCQGVTHHQRLKGQKYCMYVLPKAKASRSEKMPPNIMRRVNSTTNRRMRDFRQNRKPATEVSGCFWLHPYRTGRTKQKNCSGDPAMPTGCGLTEMSCRSPTRYLTSALPKACRHFFGRPGQRGHDSLL